MSEIITKIFDSHELPILSGQGEAVKNIYDVHRGKDGMLWLVANNIANCADAIYHQGNKNSNGFSGAAITFDISHGDKIVLSGAWKTSANYLFEYTGIDVRNKYKGRVIVGMNRGKTPSGSYMRTIVEDVIYQEDWIIDEHPYDRGPVIAQDMANKLGKAVFLFQQSLGGSSSRFITPE